MEGQVGRERELLVGRKRSPEAAESSPSVDFSRSEYLKDPDVDGFVNWLKDLVWGNGEFYHWYAIKNDPQKGQKWRLFNGGADRWEVDSLREAYEKYYWPLKGMFPGYHDNKKELDRIAKAMKTRPASFLPADMDAFLWYMEEKHSNGISLVGTTHKALDMLRDGTLNANLAGLVGRVIGGVAAISVSGRPRTREESLLISCLNVLRWGGVLRGGSEKWLWQRYFARGLVAELDHAVNLLTGSSERDVKNDFHKRLLMNAGMTKVYSLYSGGDSIIYDGRVGAALGLLVRRYLDVVKKPKVPDKLHFRWGAERISGESKLGKKKRNPSCGRWTFRSLGQSSPEHAVCNLRANWIMQEIAGYQQQMWGISGHHEKMRALEAALFMIGYDVSTACP